MSLKIFDHATGSHSLGRNANGTIVYDDQEISVCRRQVSSLDSGNTALLTWFGYEGILIVTSQYIQVGYYLGVYRTYPSQITQAITIASANIEITGTTEGKFYIKNTYSSVQIYNLLFIPTKVTQ